jgi:exopolyphosphatase/guanosine-5'-triphosphate,3'-diphosphate pyrophosphatase
MSKYAVIDIGTNSIRMLLAEVKDGEIKNSTKVLEMTRIGKGVNKTKRLSDDAMDRSIDALRKFKDLAIDYGASEIKAIATSAVRDALNKDEFITRVKEELGMEIDVISGEKEAELGFAGVIYGNMSKSQDILVIDIGGGSTEFIIGVGNEIKYRTSIDVGAVRMTDKHISTDPISDDEFNNLAQDIEKILRDVIVKIKEYNIEEVFGIGGTVTTLAAIDQNLDMYDRNKVHNYKLKTYEIEDMIDRFKSLNNDARKKIRGLQPKRADIILAGSIILYEILKALGVEQIIISDYDNLEGYIFSEKKDM